MKLILTRTNKTSSYTEGILMDSAGNFICHTLEDTERDLSSSRKVSSRTAIPCGTYRITLSLSPRFGRVLPLIEDVPYFTGIRIHRGNTASDTSGCVLVGEKNGYGTIKNSSVTEARVVKILSDAEKRHEMNYMEVR